MSDLLQSGSGKDITKHFKFPCSLSFHSASYSYVIRGWYSRPTWCYGTKILRSPTSTSKFYIIHSVHW